MLCQVYESSQTILIYCEFEKMEQPIDETMKPIADPTNKIDGHRLCQTRNAKWLCIRNIYEKLQKPNFYDIGGTYIENVPDWWFNCKIDKTVGIFLLHIYAGNRMEGEYSVGLGSLVEDVDDDIVKLTGEIKTVQLSCKQMVQSYITTISFKNADVENVLKNKTLLIAVEFTEKKKKNSDMLKENAESILIQHEYESLLANPVGYDFIIKSEEGDKFFVHRSLISGHSEVFKAMLQEDMTESRTGRVTLVDVSSEDLKILLEYIYTATIKVIQKDRLANLVMLADRYNIVGMRRFLDDILFNELAPNNTVDILNIADQFGCGALKHSVLLYIKKNMDLFMNESFDQIHSKSLLTEIMHIVMK